VSDTANLRTLDAAGIEEACRQTHPLWHQGLAFEPYRRRVQEALDRMGEEMRYVGLYDEQGALAASARLLDLRLQTPEGIAQACGIAAVFVRQDVRRLGLGARLIGSILAENRARGCSLALLFSDIGPDYYARLGFSPFPARDWSAPVEHMPSERPLKVRRAQPGEVERLRAMFNAHARRQTLCPVRSARWWAYFRWWRAAEPDLILLDGTTEVGYATVRFDDACLRLFEWMAPDAESSRVWAALRHVAEQSGAQRVEGWLQPTRFEAWMDIVERREAIPMLARTSGEPFVPVDGAVFEELDHF
jgi:predicted N-acetyltransferase YhbS